jgi:copper chaperone CopZ
MKTISKIIITVSIMISTASFAQLKNNKTEIVKIFGNCSMCKKNIETAGNKKNEATVVWNKETKMATISFDTEKTNQDEILKRIALAGYDSDTYKAKSEDYDKLTRCCQYIRIFNK